MPNHSNTCADSENFPGGWGVVWGIKLCGNESPRPNFGNFTMWILKFFKGGGVSKLSNILITIFILICLLEANHMMIKLKWSNYRTENKDEMIL